MTAVSTQFSSDVLDLDRSAEIERIAIALREQVGGVLRRRGIVLGLSGGIDSSVTAALAVRALGRERVLGLLMPEKDSDPESLQLGRLVAESLGISYEIEDIADILKASGCYERQAAFIRRIVPEFTLAWKFKVVLPGLNDRPGFNISSLVVQSPSGETRTIRMPADVYFGLIAATNMKQRTRKQMEYFHADRLNYAVAGTPNRLEYDQGFFVKGGDGLADVKPIAHLYKSQVYALAETLGLPDVVRKRPPTTDTFSLSQTQEEFYFSVDYATMDLCLYALNHGVSATDTAAASGLTPERVEAVFKDIVAKRRATRYLHARPLLCSEVRELDAF
ncbi:NAD(+) synthase [Alsobacter sp. R-9]